MLVVAAAERALAVVAGVAAPDACVCPPIGECKFLVAEIIQGDGSSAVGVEQARVLVLRSSLASGRSPFLLVRLFFSLVWWWLFGLALLPLALAEGRTRATFLVMNESVSQFLGVRVRGSSSHQEYS